MTSDEIAAGLLAPLWRGIPSGYKSRYARNIWQQFEDNVRSAAYTSRLSVWYDTLCRKLSIEVRRDDTAAVQAVLQAGQDKAVLKALRDETALLVLLVRVANEERKAAYQAAQEELF